MPFAHFTDPRFWQLYKALPVAIRNQADKQFKLLQANPSHPSLQFKPNPSRPGLWAVRVSLDYRALAVRGKDGLQGFWIGPHAEYNRLIR